MVGQRQTVKAGSKKPYSNPMRQRYLGTTSGMRATKPYSARRSAPPAASTAAQAMRTGGWANPVAGAEKKFVDIAATFTPAAGAVTFTNGVLLNGIATGTDASSRIGRKAVIKSILIRATASMATATAGGMFRLLIVYDKQANATAPGITDVLLADTFNSANNLSNRDRFVTIFDQITEPVSVQNNYACANVNYKGINLETIYNAGTDAAIGSIASGSIYLFVAQTGSTTIAAPVFTFKSRLRYTDV